MFELKLCHFYYKNASCSLDSRNNTCEKNQEKVNKMVELEFNRIFYVAKLKISHSPPQKKKNLVMKNLGSSRCWVPTFGTNGHEERKFWLSSSLAFFAMRIWDVAWILVAAIVKKNQEKEKKIVEFELG